MAKDYIEENGAKFPLNYTFNGVNNFVFSTDVMFEDMQALCLGLVAKLEAAEHRLHLTAFGVGMLAFLAGFGICWLAFVR